MFLLKGQEQALHQAYENMQQALNDLNMEKQLYCIAISNGIQVRKIAKH